MVQFSYIDEAYSYKDNEKPQKKPKKNIQQPEPIVYTPPIDKSVKEETEKAIKTSLNPPTYKNNYKYENDEFDTYLNLGFYSNKQEPKINKSLNELREMFNNNNKSKNEKEKESENENTTTTNIKIDVNMFNLFLFIFLGIIIIILIEQITKLAIIKAT